MAERVLKLNLGTIELVSGWPKSIYTVILEPSLENFRSDDATVRSRRGPAGASVLAPRSVGVDHRMCRAAARARWVLGRHFSRKPLVHTTSRLTKVT